MADPRSTNTPRRPPRRRGRERFWHQLELYLEFWAIAREPARPA